jgi:UPF0271 protein
MPARPGDPPRAESADTSGLMISVPRPARGLFVLNCDLGEGEPVSRTEALLSLIDVANIACGGHAGTDESMRSALVLAKKHGVLVGAHPGLCHGFGRNLAAKPTARELQSLVLHQVQHLTHHARELGVPLHHVKLHGALYHLADSDPALTDAYLTVIQASGPGLVVVSRCGGACAAQARRRGLNVWEEAFLDRGYQADGTLVPRGEPGDLIVDTTALEHRVGLLGDRGGWPAVDGTWLSLEPRTLCVHGDSPLALEFLRAARRVLPRFDAQP